MNEGGERTGYWELVKVEPSPVSSNLKPSWHHRSYADDDEWSMGMISLLPVAAYFSGTCEEMLSVPLAIADYSMELGLQAAVESGVNYGRDNDTVASFAATMVGVYRGMDDLRLEWIE